MNNFKKVNTGRSISTFELANLAMVNHDVLMSHALHLSKIGEIHHVEEVKFADLEKFYHATPSYCLNEEAARKLFTFFSSRSICVLQQHLEHFTDREVTSISQNKRNVLSLSDFCIQLDIDEKYLFKLISKSNSLFFDKQKILRRRSSNFALTTTTLINDELVQFVNEAAQDAISLFLLKNKAQFNNIKYCELDESKINTRNERLKNLALKLDISPSGKRTLVVICEHSVNSCCYLTAKQLFKIIKSKSQHALNYLLAEELIKKNINTGHKFFISYHAHEVKNLFSINVAKLTKLAGEQE